MRIMKVDSEGHERPVADGITDRAAGLDSMITKAYEALRSTPNGTHVEQCGYDEVGVYVGIYAVTRFKLVA